jgi:hypothetical protein
MINLRQIKPEDVIEPEHMAFYTEGMNFFYLELVKLNVNLFILDHVLSFPFGLFTLPGRSIFFRMVFDNFFYSSLLMITRLVTDKDPDVFTLQRFKNQIRNMVKEEYRDSFDTILRELRFDSETRKLLDKASTLRDQRVAHSLKDIVFKASEEEIVTFGELKSLYQTLEKFFFTLSFSHGYMMLPFEYSPDVRHPPGVDPRPDIEEILDLIAENSSFLHLPESNPEFWSLYRNQLSGEEIKIFNQYRQKFGLESI